MLLQGTLSTGRLNTVDLLTVIGCFAKKINKVSV
jgi:hypothetical protein